MIVFNAVDPAGPAGHGRRTAGLRHSDGPPRCILDGTDVGSSRGLASTVVAPATAASLRGTATGDHCRALKSWSWESKWK